MDVALVIFAAFAVVAKSSNGTNGTNTIDPDFNYTYLVTGNMTFYPVNWTFSIAVSQAVESFNDTNDTNATNTSSPFIYFLDVPTVPDVTLIASNNYWYEVVADSSNGVSVCALPSGVTSCVWSKTLRKYGIPVKAITFRYQSWSSGGGFFNGVKLTFYDDSIQQFGDFTDIPGTQLYTLTLALGETISSMEVVWSQGPKWNSHCCDTCWTCFGCCCKTCWTLPWVFSYVHITTSKGQDFSGGTNGNSPSNTYTYNNVAGKLLAGLHIAPRENGNDGEAPLQISGIAFYLFDNLVSVDIESVDYQGLSTYTDGLAPNNLLTWPVCNGGSGRITLSSSYSEETGTEACFTETQSQMYGAEVTVEAGIPKIGVTASGTAKWEETSSQSHTKCDKTVKTVEASYTADFEGHTNTTVTIKQFQSAISIPYSAKLYLNTQNMGNQEVMTINGKYSGIYVSSTMVTRVSGATCSDLVLDDTSRAVFVHHNQFMALVLCAMNILGIFLFDGW